MGLHFTSTYFIKDQYTNICETIAKNTLFLAEFCTLLK